MKVEAVVQLVGVEQQPAEVGELVEGEQMMEAAVLEKGEAVVLVEQRVPTLCASQVVVVAFCQSEEGGLLTKLQTQVLTRQVQRFFEDLQLKE
jgi:adenine C2-methylase RlmN of 23S rRNA A2503 and tRNA A37